jgi:ribosomal protein L16/L10AE
MPSTSTAWSPEELGESVDVVPSGPVSAVVSTVSTDRPLGLSGDLRNHDRVIARFVERGIPILPMRFGMVIADRETIAHDVLEANEALYERALRDLEGLVQYVLQVRYEPDGVLRSVVRENPAIAEARSAAQAAGPAHRAAQLRLGELVVGAIGRRRDADAAAVQQRISDFTEDLRCMLIDDPDSVADLACLVRADEADEFEAAAEDIAADSAAMLRLKLVGPIAPYDFVPRS